MTPAAWRPAADRVEWESLCLADRPVPMLQTWEWGSAKARRGSRIVRLVLATDAGPAGVQAEIRRLPGLAWAPGAPLGPGARGLGLADLRQLARVLRAPLLASPHFPINGMAPLSGRPYLPGTAVLDLDRPLEELRRGFDKKWRNALSKAERTEASVQDGTLADLLALQTALSMAKGFRPPYPEAFLIALAGSFRERFRIRVVRQRDEAVSVWADLRAAGTALYLAGASNPEGRRINASYLLAYDAMSELRARGARWLDLGGVDPHATTGVARFKQGMGARLCTFPGTYYAGAGALSGLLRALVASRLRLAGASASTGE